MSARGARGAPSSAPPLPRARWALLGLGAIGAAVAATVSGPPAASAAVADWPPFVLVAGLLLLGVVASCDGLFEACGQVVGRWSRSGPTLVVAAALLVATTTAVLNLDTSVAFLTPVLVYAARQRRMPATGLLYLSVFLANSSSLLLPGSNLTNLIVIAHHPVQGATFAAAMAAPFAAAVVATTATAALLLRRHLRAGPAEGEVTGARPRIGIGLGGVAVALVAMVTLPPAPMAAVVLAVGVVTATRRALEGRLDLATLAGGLNPPVLAGLFGLAVALGALGVTWAAPSEALRHASSVATAALGALGAVCVNNLPAASLLAARPPSDPYALLIGLNLGPNLVVTGALSGVLWLQAGRLAGEAPSPKRMSALGVVVVPASMAAALLALAATR